MVSKHYARKEMNVWIVKEDNDEVTMAYMEMIKEACINAGLDACIIEINEVSEKTLKKDLFFSITSTTMLKLLITGRKNVCLWLQGVVPEESLMRHNSFLRYKVLSFIEKLSLKYAKYILFVSEEMREHVISKYCLSDIPKNNVIPCFNTEINKESFEKNKYKKNVFCYAGGMSVWQEFDKVLEIYSGIEKKGLKDCKLLLLVPDKNLAQLKIKEYGINNYEIDYVPVSELNNRIREAKFGFLFRKDNIVNKVATPTKISTYLANGIIPIFSDVLVPFYKNSKHMKYVIPVNQYKDVYDKIMDYVDVDDNSIWIEYNDFFEKYYNREKYIKMIEADIKQVING